MVSFQARLRALAASRRSPACRRGRPHRAWFEPSSGAMATAQLELAPPRASAAGRSWPGAAADPARHRGDVSVRRSGGVSSWCDLLVRGLDEFDWSVLPIVAPDGRPPLYALPPHAREVGPHRGLVGAAPARAAGRRGDELPGTLVRGLIGWGGDTERRPRRVRCVPPPSRRRAAGVPVAREAGGLPRRRCGQCSTSAIPEAGTPPRLDLVEAAALYQTLYWVARTAAAPTPEADLLHVTAAGWSAVPARRPQGAARHADGAHRARRLPARGLPRGVARRRLARRPVRRHAAGARARPLRRTPGRTSICPVTDANAYWEMGLGDRPGEDPRALQRPAPAAAPVPPPGTRHVVVSVGRIDPLKDIHTLLRVAAETLRAAPGRALPALRRRERTARRPTGAPAWRCTRGSGSATASGSWAARPTPTAPCATPTSC